METNDQYNTLSEDVAEGFYSEKRSKFYAFAFHVETEEQVHDIVQTYRKRFYDARHVCYAFMLGADEPYRAPTTMANLVARQENLFPDRFLKMVLLMCLLSLCAILGA